MSHIVKDHRSTEPQSIAARPGHELPSRSLYHNWDVVSQYAENTKKPKKSQKSTRTESTIQRSPSENKVESRCVPETVNAIGLLPTFEDTGTEASELSIAIQNRELQARKLKIAELTVSMGNKAQPARPSRTNTSMEMHVISKSSTDKAYCGDEDDDHPVGYVLDDTGTAFVRGPYEVERHFKPQLTSLLPAHFSIIPRALRITPFDNLMLDFVQNSRQLVKQGFPIREVLGSIKPRLNYFADPNSDDRTQILAELVVRMILTFPLIPTFAERVALTYIVFVVSRWYISPTIENYNLLPAFMAPSVSQLLVPHSHWIDYVVFPKIRDAQIQSPRPFSFDEFIPAYSAYISVNWSEGEKECVESITNSSRPGDSMLTISPKFEAHIRNITNWSVGQAFVDAMPSYTEFVRVKDQPGWNFRPSEPIKSPWLLNGRSEAP